MRCHLCVAAALAVFASASLAPATMITYANQDFSNAAVREWRTAATPKTLDLDGDNIYGTAG